MNIHERNNQSIDIATPNRLFQGIIYGSNRIHMYGKKALQIWIIFFSDHISTIH